MDGVPVWLASCSYRDRHGQLLASASWKDDPEMFGRASKVLARTLRGVGDPDRQRMFRMPVTLCLHRALSDEEVAGLSGGACTPVNLAGGPLEVLWETVPGGASTKPCAQPGRQRIDPLRSDLYVLVECGACASCQARAGLVGSGGNK